MKSLCPRFCRQLSRDATNRKDSRSGRINFTWFTAALALSVLLGGTDPLLGQDNSSASMSDRTAVSHGADVAALYRLQASFHRASTVHDPLNGDSEDMLNQRVRAMLSLWTDTGWWFFSVGGARDGYYIGNGDPLNPSTCPLPSDNFANRGTLCTFFKYVAPPFQPANKFLSLAPAYKTEIHVYGSYATLSFECHFFNVAADPATGNPLWAPAGHLSVDAGATTSGKGWRLSHANVQLTGIPVP